MSAGPLDTNYARLTVLFLRYRSIEDIMIEAFTHSSQPRLLVLLQAVRSPSTISCRWKIGALSTALSQFRATATTSDQVFGQLRGNFSRDIIIANTTNLIVRL